MRNEEQSVLTALRAEIPSKQVEVPERGIRYWSYAELPSDKWFYVETTELSDGEKGDFKIRHFFTPSFDTALSLAQARRSPRVPPSSRICLYFRSPISADTGHYFEQIREARRLPGHHGYLLHLECGLCFVETPNPREAREVVGPSVRIFP